MFSCKSNRMIKDSWIPDLIMFHKQIYVYVIFGYTYRMNRYYLNNIIRLAQFVTNITNTINTVYITTLICWDMKLIIISKSGINWLLRMKIFFRRIYYFSGFSLWSVRIDKITLIFSGCTCVFDEKGNKKYFERITQNSILGIFFFFLTKDIAIHIRKKNDVVY